MAAQSNVHELRVALEAQGEGLQAALVNELARQAQEAVRFMKLRAPKWRSTLTNSIHAEKVSDVEWLARPGADYARAVEDGSKPGKGLPRWGDPEAADIVAWLASKAFKGRRRAHGGARKAAENKELRDRYQGLAWHVRHYGIKPNPFVGPTAEMLREQFPRRMALAARRFLAAQGGGATGSAA